MDKTADIREGNTPPEHPDEKRAGADRLVDHAATRLAARACKGGCDKKACEDRPCAPPAK